MRCPAVMVKAVLKKSIELHPCTVTKPTSAVKPALMASAGKAEKLNTGTSESRIRPCWFEGKEVY